MKENKKAKKVVALLLCAVLLVVGSVTGTMAYLTSQDTVTNTFTVGNVTITMDETKVDVYGKPLTGGEAGRGDANTYKLIPGHTYTKDPIIYVTADSEDCFVFVQIDNAISAYEDNSATIASQITAKGWTQGNGTDIPANVYYKTSLQSNPDRNLEVFDNFTIDKNANKFANWSSINPTDTKINVTAYAIQKDGLDEKAAWTALTTP